MNERIAVQPSAPASDTDLRFLLSHVGPYVGRYILACPSNWVGSVLEATRGLGDVERHRIKTRLEKAERSLQVLCEPGMEWSEARSWLQNAELLLGRRNGVMRILVHERNGSRHETLEDWDPKGSSTGDVPAQAEELAAAGAVLLRFSAEIILVDQYLDPGKADRRSVLEAMISIAAQGRCERITLVSSTKAGIDRESMSEIKVALTKLWERAAKKKFPIELHILKKYVKLHPRYLLTEKGAIHYDGGFEEHTPPTTCHIAVLSEEDHLALLAQYRQHLRRDSHVRALAGARQQQL